MGCRCGSMCAKIWKNNPHSQNAIVEPSEFDKIESNQFQLFISTSFASVLNHPIPQSCQPFMPDKFGDEMCGF